jgi:hypothetical protein
VNVEGAPREAGAVADRVQARGVEAMRGELGNARVEEGLAGFLLRPLARAR